MTMTNEEIIRDYREAKAPMKQIGILADMNCCTRKEIVAILVDAGLKVPKLYQKRPNAEKTRGVLWKQSALPIPAGSMRRCRT